MYLRYVKHKREQELGACVIFLRAYTLPYTHFGIEQERAEKSYGRPNVGGPFTLTNCKTNEQFSAPEGLLGKWSLVYFGFTNCPDICPAELDKVTAILNDLNKNPEANKYTWQPIFISVDPARDTPDQIALYLKDFHPDYVGLVGSYTDTRAVCKAYRVYFSTPPNADPKGDYLVDHSIFVYLMDPKGRFVDAFGQAFSKEDMIAKTMKAVKEWEEEQ